MPTAPSARPARPRPRLAPPRRARGTGSIKADAERGGFRAIIKIATPQHPEGETFRKRFGAGEYRDAEAWLDDIVRTYRGGGAVPRRPQEMPTVGAFAAEWLENKRASLSPKTYAIYEGSLRLWLVPVLGTVRLDWLTDADVRRYVVHLRTAPGGRQGKPLRFETQHIHWRFLRTILRAAVRQGYIDRTPLQPEDAPVRPRDEPQVRATDRAIPEDMVARIVYTLNADAYQCTPTNHAAGRCRASWLVRAATGIRQGEATACLVRDADVREWSSMTGEAGISGVLTLQRHAERVPWKHGCPIDDPCGRRWGADCPARHGGGMIAAPGLKSDGSGRRVLHLSSGLATALRDHVRVLVSEGMAGPDAFLFGRGATMWQPEQDTRHWRALLDAAGIDAHYRVHDLRHTALTVVARSVSLLEAQRVAGHGSSRTTEENYVHPDATWTAAGIEASTEWLERLGSGSGLAGADFADVEGEDGDEHSGSLGVVPAASSPTVDDGAPW